MLIREWMTKNPTVIGPSDTLAQAKRIMETGNFRRLPVVDAGELVGIITERDLRQQIGQLDHTRVDAMMARSVVTVTPYMLLDQAAYLLVKHKIGGLPVLDGRQIVGIITAIDMLRAFCEVLGTVEEGVARIDLEFSGNSFDLMMISSLVGQMSGELLGMGTYESRGDSGKQLVYVRVRAENADRIADMLTDNDFTVAGIHS
jgi:acetoin utilization protein AcuB